MKTLKTLSKFFVGIFSEVLAFLVFFAVFSWLAMFLRGSIEAADRVHWIAGAAVGFLCLAGILTLIFVLWYAAQRSAPEGLREYMWIRKSTAPDAGLAERYPGAAIGGLVCGVILAAVFAVTLTSSILEAQGYLTYAHATTRALPMTEALFRTYAWHAIDMVPLVDIWDTYEIGPPLRPVGFAAQTGVLVFRTALVGFALSLVVQGIRWSREEPVSGGTSS